MEALVASANAKTVTATEREALAKEQAGMFKEEADTAKGRAKRDVAAAVEQAKRDVAAAHGSVRAIEEKYKLELAHSKMLSEKCAKIAKNSKYRAEFLGDLQSTAHPEFNTAKRVRLGTPGVAAANTAEGDQPPSPRPSPRN